MACDRATDVAAYLDGELDATAALAVEHHLESCSECAALLRELEALRGGMRQSASYHRADPALRARVRAVLDEAAPAGKAHMPQWLRSAWAGAAGGVMATALAASLAFFFLLPAASDVLVTDITNAHLRSIASEHLIDVASTDRHTVKPWLAAHADLSPPVADFTRQGFRLVGGRVDFVDGARAAVTVYRHGAHIINVFAWTNSEGRLPQFATRNGYHIVFWQSGNLAFCAISDTAVDELLELSRLLKEMSLPDGRE